MAQAFLKELIDTLDYCSSDINHDQARKVVEVGICPSEMNNDEEVTAVLSYVILPSVLVITDVAIRGGHDRQKVSTYARQVEERTRLPFFIESSEHVKLFVKMCICTEFLSDSDAPPFVPPALWLCPMRVGVPFRGNPEAGSLESLTSEPRYAKFLDWVHSPPNFPAISLNGADQRCTPPIPTALGNRVVLSGAQEVNACCSMRMYVDDADKSNAIVKISPHLFFQIFGKGADKAQRGNPKTLCDSINSLSGCLGLTYHLRFPPDYPEKAPLVRMLTPHVSGGHVLSSGAVCCDILLDKFWKARQSFDAAFQAVIILHCDDSPMRATGAAMYPSEKAAKLDISIDFDAKVCGSRSNDRLAPTGVS